MNSQLVSNRILKKSKTDFINIDDEEVIDVDERSTSFKIIDSGSDNCDDDGNDEDEFDRGGVPEDPIESFSDLNPNDVDEINHGTKLGISEQKANSLSDKTDLSFREMVEHSNGSSEISEVSHIEKLSSHNKREYSSNDNDGHTDHDNDDDDGDGDNNDNESYAYEDLQCRSVDGETHAVKSDSGSDSSIELTRPRFR